jgi:hypothetical protein
MQQTLSKVHPLPIFKVKTSQKRYGAVKKVAIIQSNYIPWKGYFDMIAAADEVILYDDMQYTRRDWRNRNKIKTSQGVQWLTVPVKVKGEYYQAIRETKIVGTDWGLAHWKALEQNYRRASHFAEISAILEPIYLGQEHTYLSALNRKLIEVVCAYLGINTKISNSWDYHLIDGKTERLADLCVQAGGAEYISGPAAKDYIEEQAFTDRGINLLWFDYTGYLEYPQLWGDFTHGVTILDLLFNCGRDTPSYMRYVRL